MTTARAMLSARTPGNTTGRLAMTPCSLPEAMSEPENVTAPITTSRTVGTPTRAGMAPPCAVVRRKSCAATSAAAPPPTALNRLTSCGIAVIATVRAAYQPASVPTQAPAASTIQPVVETVPERTSTTRVAATAAAMPLADRVLPRRAVTGELIRCRPMTEHDAVDRVRGRHQWRVQGRRYLADHLEANEQGEHEDAQVGKERGGHDRLSSSSPAIAGCTTEPSWVSSTAAWISSVGSMARRPSRSRCSTSALMLRLYAVDAAVGIVAGRLSAPITVTPSSVTTVRPG